MVSSLTQKGKQITLDSLDAGAVDFVSKPTSDIARGLKDMLLELRAKVKLAASANVSHWKAARSAVPSQLQTLGKRALAESTDKVIAIGASTGGTEAIRKIIAQFPATMPGVVIVQHMPAGFTRLFAERLNQLCAMEVKEAESGDRIMPGRVLIGPGGFHMKVVRSGGLYQVRCEPGPPVKGHCPSVDVMMHSVAQHVGANAVGVMLTGMGSDGAEGMKAMRDAGARNLAQDEASCVVFGMPKVAYEMGGAHSLVSLDNMANRVVDLLSERRI
jgi:two-component system chemotaxis response regulator CheB